MNMPMIYRGSGKRAYASSLRAAIVALAAVLAQCLPASAAAAASGTVDVGPITVSPELVLSGRRPVIEARVSVGRQSKTSTVAVNVVASVTQPDHRMRSWRWKTTVSRDAALPIAVPKEFDCTATGIYRVDIIVYSDDMRQRYAFQSRSFEVTTEEAIRKSRGAPGRTEKRERAYAGIGIYGNALNPAGGGTVLLWPARYLGVQTLYSVGTFDTYEGRVLAKYDLSERYGVYAGVGYAHVTADRDIIGVSTRFEDGGLSGAVGVEVALGKKVFLYVEGSAARITLERTVTNGSETVLAKVKYAPATIGCSLVWMMF